MCPFHCNCRRNLISELIHKLLQYRLEMIKVDHQNCSFDSILTPWLKSVVVFKKAWQSLYISTLKYVLAPSLEHFYRSQRRKRKLHANMYSWFCHAFLTAFVWCEQKTQNVSRNLMVLLSWSVDNAIQKSAFPWTAPQKLIHKHVLWFGSLFACVPRFRGYSDEKCLFHELASLVHKPSGCV